MGGEDPGAIGEQKKTKSLTQFLAGPMSCAGSAKRSDVVNIAEVFKTYDKVGLLQWSNWAAMEGCVATCVLGGASMTMVDMSWKVPQSQLRLLVSISGLSDTVVEVHCCEGMRNLE